MPLTKDERDWVEGQLPIFIQHQNQKMVADFWPQIRAAFFLKFPLDGEDNPAMDVESHSALGKISDSKFSVKSFTILLLQFLLSMFSYSL